MKSMIAILTILLSLTATAGLADLESCGNAVYLALELSGDLLADPALVLQIDEDLGAIRTAYPTLADINVFPTWVPDHIAVGLTDEAMADYEAGTFAALDSLNAIYGPVTSKTVFSILFLYFDNCYHSEVLASEYAHLEGARYASPGGVAGDGSDITCTRLSYYTFKRGSGDCLSGCLVEEFWDFSVLGGTVELLAHYWNSSSGIDSSPSASTGVVMRNTPNPFNPLTMIQYRLAADSWVRLRIYDAKGRLVNELQNEFVTQGDQEVTWDARDRPGISVASGVYYSQLMVDGVEYTGKMMVMK